MNFILKNKILLPILCLGCVLVFLNNCGSDSKTQKQKTVQKDKLPIPKDKDIFTGTPGKRGGKMILSLLGNPNTFNPFFAQSVSTNRIISQIYGGFFSVRLDTMKRTNYLVKDYTISSDKLTYTLHLREGVRWSDGAAFTADDVLFSFQIVTDARWATYGREGLMDSQGNFPTFKKLNDYAIAVTIKEPNVLFESALSNIRMLPKHKWQKSVEDGTFPQQLLINTKPEDILSLGPYRIKSFTPDQSLILERNPHFWRFDKNGTRLPYLDKIVYLIVPNTDTHLVKFRNGETDFYEISVEDYDLIKREEKDSNYKVMAVGPSYIANWITVNQNPGKNSKGEPYLSPQKLKLFSDKRFRQALSYAIDREGMVNVAFHGQGFELYTYNTPANKIWFNANAPKFSYNPEKAKALLTEIGLKDQDGDGYVELWDGTPLKIDIKTNVEDKSRIQMGNLIKDDFKKIGIQSFLQAIPFNSLTDTMYKTHDFDAIILGWGAGVPPDPLMAQNVLLSQGRLHVWHPQQKSPYTEWEKQIDELFYKMKATFEQEKRVQIWHEISNIFNEQQAQIMLACGKKYVAIQNHIQNFSPVALPYPDWNTDELFIEEKK